MQEQIGNIPACFSSSEKNLDDPTKSGQSKFVSIYRTKIADKCRLITVTWIKNAMIHGLSVAVEGPDGESHYNCKVELKPWCFWRKQGSKQFVLEGNNNNNNNNNNNMSVIEIFWDLKSVKFNGETEPCSDYYIALVCNEEVVLLLGDMKKDAYRKTNSRPSLIDPILVSRKEHLFGNKKFISRGKFHEKGRLHEISVECRNRNNALNNGVEPELEIRIDGKLFIHVKHLQWKFRGNESIHLNKVKIEVYWDVHDWLFNPGLRHALFIFKPMLLSSSTSSSSTSTPISSSLSSTPLSSQTGSSSSSEGFNSNGSSPCSLFLYAWRVE